MQSVNSESNNNDRILLMPCLLVVKNYA